MPEILNQASMFLLFLWFFKTMDPGLKIAGVMRRWESRCFYGGVLLFSVFFCFFLFFFLVFLRVIGGKYPTALWQSRGVIGGILAFRFFSKFRSQEKLSKNHCPAWEISRTKFLKNIDCLWLFLFIQTEHSNDGWQHFLRYRKDENCCDPQDPDSFLIQKLPGLWQGLFLSHIVPGNFLQNMERRIKRLFSPFRYLFNFYTRLILPLPIKGEIK